jgi:hypothetical protein
MLTGDLVQIKYIHYIDDATPQSYGHTFKKCLLLSNKSFIDLLDKNKLKLFIKEPDEDEKYIVEKI